jgi:hypothetical protein
MTGNGDAWRWRLKEKGEREERVRHTDRQTHRQTHRQRFGGRGGREGGRLTVYRMREDQKRRQPHHTTRYDTTHRNNDRDRHRTRRDMTGNGDAWR